MGFVCQQLEAYFSCLLASVLHYFIPLFYRFIIIFVWKINQEKFLLFQIYILVLDVLFFSKHL